MNFEETIFLTGFPGFIAERLVERLANPDTQFFLLVQKQFVEKAVEAVERIAGATNTPLENFAIVEGDITRKNLGIGDDDLATIRVETTDVFHLAAVYDLAVTKDLAFLVNVEGTKNVNDFVRSLWNLKRYNYISTCYVAGKRKGEILETELAHDAGFRNYYEETKYLAEVSVEEMKTDFPVCIFRPSVVVGDSQTGETAKYDGIYYLIKYLQKAPKLLPPLTGLPHSGVPYFFLSQTYDTSLSEKLLREHDISCPNFKTYVGNLIKFVEKNPEI